MNRFPGTMLACAAILIAALTSAPYADAEEPTEEGGWLIEREEPSGLQVHRMQMTLHARAEPRPALKYRLIPDEFDMVEGNAAIYYLMAMGFLEQNAAHKRLFEVYDQANEQARREGKEFHQVAPMSFFLMAPGDLPLEDVKEFLQLTSFQPRYLAEAGRRRRFNMERNLRETDDPISYLLPEMHAMRELARTQNIRCKVAIAENRIDDAIAILGQQYMMVRHLGQDDFLISAFVGAACAEIAWDDALYLVQHEETPNLYWAFASIPRPAVDLSHSLAIERQFLYLQLKTLQEVDQTPRPAGYWQDFIDRLISDLGGLSEEFGLSAISDDPDHVRAAMVAFIAVAYPGAKRYLVEACGLDRELVESYPTAQTVFLAIVRYYEAVRDDCFKWSHLPHWQAVAATRGFDFRDYLSVSMERAGWIATPAKMLLPAIQAARTASARIDQQLALLQTVEAIRMYASGHGGKLPPSLDDLPLPAPMEPFTGKPLDYRCHGDHAVLNGHDLPGMRYQLVLRFARDSE